MSILNPMASYSSYPKVWNLGHANLDKLLDGPVIVEEMLDGSQLSFGRFKTEYGYELRARSKGAELNFFAPERMFATGIEQIGMLAPDLTEGWTYRVEYFAKPKHNTLAYDRVPQKHMVLFDVTIGEERYLDSDAVRAEGARLGLECPPIFLRGALEHVEKFRELLDRVSMLGGPKVEGLVVKNHAQFGRDGKPLFGKYVSEAFKETHGTEWREANPTKNDIIQLLIHRYRTPARWSKAVQHAREAGLLEDSPRDIGLLMKMAREDIWAECKEEIQAEILRWAESQLSRGMVAGLAEWYKDELLKKQFSQTEGTSPPVALPE